MALSDIDNRMGFAVSSDAEILMKGLDSRPEGHYNEEVTTSRIKFGDNVVTNNNKHMVLKRLYHSFVNIFTIALAAVDIILPLCDIAQGNEINVPYVIILTTLILVSGLMTFIQETRSSNAAHKLISMVTTIITLRREGVEIEVDSADLVVGDIVILDSGDTVPADVRILKSNHLKVDQSAFTGESGAVTKTDEPMVMSGNILECNNMAFMGSNVISGSAEAIVIAVGDDTIFGSMAEKLTRKKEATTYDKGTKAIAKLLIKLMIITVPIVFAIIMAKGLIFHEDPFEVFKYAIFFAITLAVGLMPEMLSTIVSTNLAKGAVDMSKRKVIVKDTTSIQNFGAMDVLCSDKTGTLTHNRISVQVCSDIHGNRSHAVELFSCLNSRNLTSSTNQIDWAVNEFAEENGFLDELEQYPYVADVPFDFFRRRATVIVNQNKDVDLLITKGAIPEILSISSAYLDENGEIQVLADDVKNHILGLMEWYSEKGLRLLGVGYKYIPHVKTVTDAAGNTKVEKEFTEKDECELIFTGFIVFIDPVKETAKKAIADLAEYGIKTKVLTGDNEYVTRHVGEEIGVRVDNLLVGPQIDKMSDEELKKAVEETEVFVRLTPDNKNRIVLALRANGHTVGVMGDGINDVIAMKNADISISVDTGTDIAKDTANMILLEKDLDILKRGAIEGRKVYVNTMKYVKMTGSINFGYMISLILATLLFNFNPMGAMMILIFNLVIDFGCLVIPWDTVEDEFVRKPCKWDATNLKTVMTTYGLVCPLTDIMTWLFMIFVILMPCVTVIDGVTVSIGQAILDRTYMMGTPAEVLFQSIWFIEQFWMQVWAIHIVRTNKLPFFQSWSSKLLVFTSILGLVIGTALPFTGQIWKAIAGFDLISMPMESLIAMAIWMPSIAVFYFFVSHLVKRRVLKKHGYFAC